MVLIRVPKPWQSSAQPMTSEAAYRQRPRSRRRFLKQLGGAAMGAAAVSILGCDRTSAADPAHATATLDPELLLSLDQPRLDFASATEFADAGRPVTGRAIAGQYNNYYEFGSGKSIWQAAQALPTDPWRLEVTGLVKNPQVYDLDDLTQRFPLEERVYRLRCVEAWSMVMPWVGFPMAALLAAVEPRPAAKFASFTTYYDEAIRLGPERFANGDLVPWPYTEGLRVDEMANELAFFAVGIYGRTLPKQFGAPIRAVVPWKYGFKGAKSIVKIEFLAEQPATFWNTLTPEEYGFVENVNPNLPHPRWSQATEKFIYGQTEFEWEERPTLPYNGYGEYVAALYE
ncbi:MAG: protein-methionine-sulfoxide reductase catalytic subunit MsrP [Spirulinaceae cyanobacterium SM2_1_0]|nr:protein-methionine-sulfoxide reductase catalytic subunit MsrP [Spirulinaceae cyanobacterium SM2_1_0]